jgi:hypothetical protein
MAKVTKKQEVRLSYKDMTDEEKKAYVKKQQEKDSEMVFGVFKNLENPARNGSLGALSFPYKAYPDEEVVIYELLDGEKYNLPRGVARHLNMNCYTREYENIPGETGRDPIKVSPHNGRQQVAPLRACRKIHRFAFHSLDYTDEDQDMTPVDIIEVNSI